MILVTVGTNEQPFDRLVRAAAELGGSEELLVQHGSSTVPPGRGRWVDFLPFHELEQHAREARVVVCHAGVGSIMLARRAGRRPVVMARRHRLGEAVDDHQLTLARRLAQAGLVELAEDGPELARIVLSGASGAPDGGLAAGMPGTTAMTAELRGLFAALGAAPGRAARPLGHAG